MIIKTYDDKKTIAGLKIFFKKALSVLYRFGHKKCLEDDDNNIWLYFHHDGEQVWPVISVISLKNVYGEEFPTISLSLNHTGLDDTKHRTVSRCINIVEFKEYINSANFKDIKIVNEDFISFPSNIFKDTKDKPKYIDDTYISKEQFEKHFKYGDVINFEFEDSLTNDGMFKIMDEDGDFSCEQNGNSVRLYKMLMPIKNLSKLKIIKHEGRIEGEMDISYVLLKQFVPGNVQLNVGYTYIDIWRKNGQEQKVRDSNVQV